MVGCIRCAGMPFMTCMFLKNCSAGCDPGCCAVNDTAPARAIVNARPRILNTAPGDLTFMWGLLCRPTRFRGVSGGNSAPTARGTQGKTTGGSDRSVGGSRGVQGTLDLRTERVERG